MGRKATGRTTKVISIRVSKETYNYLNSLIADNQSVNQWVKQLVVDEIQDYKDYKDSMELMNHLHSEKNNKVGLVPTPKLHLIK